MSSKPNKKTMSSFTGLQKKGKNQPKTILECIEDILFRNQIFPHSQIPSDQKYTIYQDLKLIREMHKQTKRSLDLFEGFQKKKVLKYKSAKSMMQRYLEVLYFVRRDEMKKIFKHYQDFGLAGTIVKNNREIEIIVQNSQKQFSEGSQSGTKKLKKNCSSQNCKTNDSEKTKKSFLEEAVSKENPSEYLNQESEESLVYFRKVESDQQDDNYSDLSQKESLCFLSETIDHLSQKYQTNPTFLLDTLDKLSGDIQVLEKYLETKDHKLLWIEDQDKPLIEKDQQLIDYLIKMRGIDNVMERKRYLKLE